MDLLAVLSGFGVGGGSLMTPLLATLGDVEWGLLTALLLGAGIKVLA